MNKDPYLKKFILYCRKKFDNLAAVVICGSYGLDYFNKKESDYDIIIIFKDKVQKGKSSIKKIFKRIDLHYFCTLNYLSKRGGAEHWASYMALTKTGKILYKTEEYDKFLEKFRKKGPLEKTNISALKKKMRYEKNVLNRLRKFKALKWAFLSIRKRLSLLNYTKNRKKIWEFKKVLLKNRNFFTKKELDFLKELERKVKTRKSNFRDYDKKTSLEILSKIDKELLSTYKTKYL